ncbi:MAG: hypothetical protein EA397_18690 [Deltaproteobacteria bacterium]|nr:MAG: hypothetical protein EA397_18690 [Deltaproteobacteria bacterium]
MDLHTDTLNALDWPVVVQALAQRARTSLGAAAARALAPLPDPEHALRAFDEVDELELLAEAGDDLPIGGIEDIRAEVIGAHKGEVLAGPDLRRVGLTLGTLRELSWFFDRQGERVPRLAERAAAIQIDDVLADDLLMAFDTDGTLSARTYPELGELRRRITDLHANVRETLQQLLRGDALHDLLQDDFVTQRNDRYVLPIKAHAKRWDLGIVHGTSGSGQTVYIEPRQVVELNNRLRLAEAALEQAERRILIQLSAALGRARDEVLHALQATATLDLAVARRALAHALGASRPVVAQQGVIQLRQARHPVLVLREIEVVGNDLSLSAERPALVLSGPNAGGKTVSLKTIGLCALLVQHGCFVPAEPGSRVDFFDAVLASIGDTQTVHDDLSSFSGHLFVLSKMIARAAPGHLLLLDELASGTDPSQGAALAQAVLERLLGQGPRVVLTTHYARLKAMPASDPRFAAAAVEYADGQPTYRVLPDAHGQSHALSIAAKMGLDDALIDRARALMDEGERDLADLLQALDRARAEALEARADARTQAERLAAREAEVARREAKLKNQADALREQAARQYRDRLAQAEQAIRAVVADLQRDPSHARVKAAKASLGALTALAPAPEPEPQQEPPSLRVGDAVKLRKHGTKGMITTLSGGAAQVRAGALHLRVPLSELELDRTQPEARPNPPAARPHRPGPDDPADALRMPSNTLDLRGHRVDESFDEIERFFSKALLAGHGAVFLLHGHGTGALKQAIRKWLPSHPAVSRWGPATSEQGGDAFTIAVLDAP